MALLADRSGDANSNLVTGQGTESVTFTVPANVYVKVESVVATITNGAASDVAPELTIRDQSGVVIARKAQRQTIPAGDSGTATFALRLGDDDATPSGSQTLTDLIIATGPSAFWKLNEPSGLVAHDSSGNGHDLAVPIASGFTSVTWAQPAGPPGDTTAEWVTRTDRLSGSLVDFSDNFTAGVWIKMNSLPLSAYEIMGQGQSEHSSPGWALTIQGSDNKFGVVLPVHILHGDLVATTGTWYFVATVRDAGTWKLYVNGVLQTNTLADAPGAAGFGTNTWLGNDGRGGVDLSAMTNSYLSYAFITNSVVSGSDLLAMYHSVVP